MELMARLPWWAGLAWAVVFYLVLHPLAEREMVINGERYQSDPGFSARSISLTPVFHDPGFPASLPMNCTRKLSRSPNTRSSMKLTVIPPFLAQVKSGVTLP